MGRCKRSNHEPYRSNMVRSLHKKRTGGLSGKLLFGLPQDIRAPTLVQTHTPINNPTLIHTTLIHTTLVHTPTFISIPKVINWRPTNIIHTATHINTSHCKPTTFVRDYNFLSRFLIPIIDPAM